MDPKPRRLPVMLTRSMFAWLQEYAASQDVSMSQVVREALARLQAQVKGEGNGERNKSTM